MNIYRLLKYYRKIKNHRIRALGLLGLHLAHRRYVNLFFDPVLACNLSCRMCYFSVPSYRKSVAGKRFSMSDVEAIAGALFPRMLRVQIGCGAEPTVYPHLEAVVELAHRYRVPYISLTTNGNLLSFDKMRQLVEAGLNEITISCHGFSKEMYENMMQCASFDKFLALTASLKQLQSEYAHFKVRLNFTVNEENMTDIPLMPTVLDGLRMDVIQIRPIQKLGETSYSNFSKTKILEHYDELLKPAIEHFKAMEDTTIIYPTKQNLMAVDGIDSTDTTNEAVDAIPQFYLGPDEGWREQFDPYHETFDSYCRRTGRVSFLLRCIFSRSVAKNTMATKKLNYEVDN